jgi:hypothetical protein
VIFGGYSLDLYCDGAVKCRNRGAIDGFAAGRFTGETFSECARKAKQAGWKLKRNGMAFCPLCKTDYGTK